MKFRWDGSKADNNRRKHRVSFETATRVFLDSYHLTEQDRIEDGEYRYQTIGMVDGTMILLVAHVDGEEDGIEIVRLISAREATPREKKRYGQNRFLQS